jgi:hypothetical protein
VTILLVLGIDQPTDRTLNSMVRRMLNAKPQPLIVCRQQGLRAETPT